MRVLYTLTLIKPVIAGCTWDELTVGWTEYHLPRVPVTIPLAWAATRSYVLQHMPDVTDLEDAHLEIVLP